jgi:hypothetical protein
VTVSPAVTATPHFNQLGNEIATPPVNVYFVLIGPFLRAWFVFSVDQLILRFRES